MNRLDLDTALRSLDRADRAVDPTSPRAQADLRAILASDPSGAILSDPPRPAGAARAVRRVVLVVGAVSVAAAGVVVLPSVTGGDTAFATWTAAPGTVPAEQRPGAVDACRASHTSAGEDYADDLAVARGVVAERRGEWTTVVLAGTDGFSALCVTDDSALLSSGMIGSVGRADVAAPGPREVVATSLGTGATAAGELSLAAGTVGSDVVGVLYRSATHGDVAATVAEGHFAFWVPGAEMEDGAGVDVEITYRDGSTGTVRLTL
ncbi:hypothetical protein [Cellulomonas cellasea]|uniref:Uncharacterized protein n=2 Tax=Cellulomonas cellasea TaxID=43670 RepID=A0A0A0B4N5_9CELL|nr:hypothetical protein [Cellulomonas cellasea]KGM01117.1 hypothetical protein Q760_03670 [Cellulomonas cellasea DSM 20118]GEA87555.1 hypothetical protein CCE01nite_15040 [Cellulomonas cellasea]